MHAVSRDEDAQNGTSQNPAARAETGHFDPNQATTVPTMPLPP